MNYQNFYIGRVLNALSQLGNALINGNPYVSISARIGYENYFYNNKLYRVFECIVDKTFEPIDGKEHCKNAYLRDRKEDYGIGRGWILGEWLMVIILMLSCVPLSIIFWIYYLIKQE